MPDLSIASRRECEFIEITQKINELVPQNIKSGICHIFCQHTTAGLTINENADDDVKQDIFDINKAPLDVFHFVGHEFIIFLLMQELKDVNELDDWKRFESLAEYYLIQILGNSRGFFDDMKDYIEFYETCNKEKNLTAMELYKKGAEFLK